MLGWLSKKIGEGLARYLETPSRAYVPFSVSNPDILREHLRPADVLLIEGDQRTSVIIKYLTQSTWSHAALYVGDALGPHEDGAEPNSLIEALLIDGVVAVPLAKYETYNTRICRPVGLADEDRRRVVDFMIDSMGMKYDLKNVTDLMRYLLPKPPVPARWRRRMLALGSGDPTRGICSTLLAQAFQSVRYPILPHVQVERVSSERNGSYSEREILNIRHHSLFAPRDFDLSPYFQTIKPTVEGGFDYKKLVWDEATPPASAGRPGSRRPIGSRTSPDRRSERGRATGRKSPTP